MIEIRHEPPDGPAAKALFEEYLAFTRERIGDFTPADYIFATPEVFEGPGAAWLVVYEDGEPIACGGLRPVPPDAGEIKRMFVTARARGRGHARRRLAALEDAARAAGNARVVMVTSDPLEEARTLYASAGYTVTSDFQVEGRTDYWLEKRL